MEIHILILYVTSATLVIGVRVGAVNLPKGYFDLSKNSFENIFYKKYIKTFGRYVKNNYQPLVFEKRRHNVSKLMEATKLLEQTRLVDFVAICLLCIAMAINGQLLPLLFLCIYNFVINLLVVLLQRYNRHRYLRVLTYSRT